MAVDWLCILSARSASATFHNGFSSKQMNETVLPTSHRLPRPSATSPLQSAGHPSPPCRGRSSVPGRCHHVLREDTCLSEWGLVLPPSPWGMPVFPQPSAVSTATWGTQRVEAVECDLSNQLAWPSLQ